MNIRVIKLSTGEELLCEYKEGTTNVVIENPMQIMPVPHEDGQHIGIGMAPWMPASKDRKFKITNKQHIITTTVPAPDLAAQYASAFGGIVVPEIEVVT